MPLVDIEAFPIGTRVRLSREGNALLWDRVEEYGGITRIASESGIPRSRMYNWKHKQSFIPARVVCALVDDADQYVVAVKGGGRSVPTTLSHFPLTLDEELLTRIACSVHVNADGVPTYQAHDAGLTNRFIDLLQQIGEVPISVYHRSTYEVRYPKYLHDIVTTVAFEEDRAALVDEMGRIENGTIRVNDQRFPVQDVKGVLYHRGKKLQLALARGDTVTITQLMASEAEKVQQLVED